MIETRESLALRKCATEGGPDHVVIPNGLNEHREGKNSHFRVEH